MSPAETARAEAHRVAPVLVRMLELCGAPGAENLGLGLALERAARELGIPVPPETRPALFSAAFRILGSGRIPGCPDA